MYFVLFVRVFVIGIELNPNSTYFYSTIVVLYHHSPSFGGRVERSQTCLTLAYTLCACPKLVTCRTVVVVVFCVHCYSFNFFLYIRLISLVNELCIETGRYDNTPRHNRIFKYWYMNCIEDKYYFILTYSTFRSLRCHFLTKILLFVQLGN